MSYRVFKRLLGETSLERKCRFLFGAVLLLLITGSFYWYGNVTETLVFKQNQIKGRLLVDTLLTRTHWVKLETDNRNRELAETLGSDLVLADYQWKFLKPDPNEPLGDNDDWEREVIARFRDNPPAPPPATSGATELSLRDMPINREERFARGGDGYEYYEAVYAFDSSCVNCHSKGKPGNLPDLRFGGLMAVAKITIPNGPTRRDLAMNRAILLSTGIVTVFLAMLAAWTIVRYVIVKPLKHLHDVSDAVSRGELDQRADIHTGDEFERLATAFNRMLRHLVETQQELQQANTTLDHSVDELARANMQLFESNRLKSDFLATMSHELRTPLNSIIGFSDVLSAVDSLDDKQKRYVQNIQKSGRGLLDLINDILDLAKIESGKMDLRPSAFPIAQVIHSQVDMARPLAERKNIDLVVEIESELPEMYQDQGKVQQILNNLLSNAIKFTPEGGRISIAARRNEADRLSLTVVDTGIGIAEEDQVVIFEKFRQGSSVLTGGDAMTREHSGTGLGLSIVKELCKLVGGEISLHSEVGKGSAFTVQMDWVLQGSEPRVPRGGDYARSVAL